MGEDKVKIVLITLGGSRQEAMESMLQHPDIEVILSPGVPSRDLRNRKKLMAALYKSRVLIKDPSLGPNMAPDGTEMDPKIRAGVERSFRAGKGRSSIHQEVGEH